MNTIKTSAIVEDSEHLRLTRKLKKFAQGTQVDLIIMPSKKRQKNYWQKVLAEIGTYSEEELSEFSDARKEFNKWQPKEF